MMKILPAIIWIVFVAALYCSAQDKFEYSYTITGRVVDEHARPVPGASITIKSPEYFEGCIIEGFSTDKDGRFLIKRELSTPITEWTIYVSDFSLVPQNTKIALDVHMGTVLTAEYHPALSGQKINVVANQINKLGDIKLQDRQFPLLVRFHDSEGNPLIEDSPEFFNKGFYPWWIIRDSRGDIISEGSNATIHHRFKESGVMIALPKGRWTLDISDNEGSGILKGSFEVDVKETTEIQEVVLKMSKDQAIIRFEGIKRTIPDKRLGARAEIERMGFQFSRESFENRVLNGNHKVVEFFLQTGMNPDILTKNEEFLIRAIQRPKVLKLLLEAGANPNGRIRDGITPLLCAIGLGLPKPTVQMLLDAGADITTKDDEGRDAFSLSEDREEILQLLIESRKKKFKN